jgi:hypothetical protein
MKENMYITKERCVKVTKAVTEKKWAITVFNSIREEDFEINPNINPAKKKVHIMGDFNAKQ